MQGNLASYMADYEQKKLRFSLRNCFKCFKSYIGNYFKKIRVINKFPFNIISMECSDVDEVQIFFVRAVLNSLFIVKSIIHYNWLYIDCFFLLMIQNKDSNVPNFVRFWGFTLNPLFEVIQFPNYNETVVALCFKTCF